MFLQEFTFYFRYFDFAQYLVPLLLRCSTHAFKVPTRNFRHQVLLCTFVVDHRNRGLHHHLFACISRELQNHFATRFCALAGLHRIAHHLCCEGFRELSIEIQLLIVSPTLASAVSTNRLIVYNLYVHGMHNLVMDAIVQVKDHTSLGSHGISIAMQRCTFGSREFCFNTISIQYHSIITGFGTFGRLTERRSKSHTLTKRFLLANILQVGTTNNWHQQEIAIVSTTRTTQTCMGKTIDALVLVVITRTSIPLVETCIRAWLNHTIGHHCSRVRVTMISCTDKEIHILCVILLLCIHRKNESQEQT